MTTAPEPGRDDGQDAALRDLAAQIAKMGQLGFDPITIRKGIVSAVVDTTSPPTVSLNLSGDTETLISAVRTLNNYTPLVGQTVLVAKQGTEIFLLGAISAGSPMNTNTTTDNGWIQADLAAGSHDGNSNGTVYYRRILDHGAWKMQWRGGWNVSGSTMVTALDPDYRPSSKRSVLVPVQIQSGSPVGQLDFGTNGSVTLVSTTAPTAESTGGQSTSGASPSGSTDSVDPIDSTTAGGADGHTHGVVGSHYHTIFVDNHWHGNGTHTHTLSVAAPTWVSLNGVEYFL